MEALLISTVIAAFVVGGLVGMIVGFLMSEPFKKTDLSKPNDQYD